MIAGYLPPLGFLYTGLALAQGADGLSQLGFNRDIRPILSENCYACHGPDQAKRKAKLRLDSAEDAHGSGVLDLDESGASELLRRIQSSDPRERMPPPDSRKVLSLAEQALLQEWLRNGAKYEQHWSYLPLSRPAVPRSSTAPSDQHPIDAFLLAAQQTRGLAPAPSAEKRTLLRRLSLDLIGLPPTPAEIADFLADESGNAWERQIERLFVSPRYGERMASFWLDVARFSDTVGYHGDQNANVFPYRDWVIQAFQRNMPLDQFTVEQLAGDLLPNADESSRVATAFLRLNMVTREGGAQPKEYLAKYAADRVRTVATTWLGSTLGCAECHDHKYDPFTTRDFYSFAAFFADIQQWGVYQDYQYTPNPDLPGWSNDHPFPPEMLVESPALQAREAKVDEQILQVLERAQREGEARAYGGWKEQMDLFVRKHPQGWMACAGELVPRSDIAPEKQVSGETLADGSVVLRGAHGESVYLRLPLAPGPLASIRLDLIPTEIHSGSIARDGGDRTWVTFGAKLRTSIADEGTQLAFHHADAELKAPRYGNGHEVLGVRGGWATQPGKEREVATGVWQLETPILLEHEAELEITLAHGSVGCARVSVSPIAGADALELDLSRALQGTRARETYLLSTSDRVDLRGELQALLRAKRECRGGKARVVVVVSRPGPPTRILPRGNWHDESGEIVSPAFPAFLAGPLPNARQQLTRLDLANWLVSRENPLCARTLVNRLWKQFFGRGLSAMLDDLGSQGEWPVHGELLDWLACELMDSGWDLQHVLRYILTSQAYRRASQAPAEQAEADPENLWLTQQTPRRLDAEFVRDQALFVAGLLSPEIGGPSCFPYQPQGYYSNLQFPDRDYKASRGSEQYRRGLYVHWQRTFLHPMLANFDAPSREECTASRVVSNTPQQALTLLNDPTFFEAAAALAGRLHQNPTASDEERIKEAFSLVLVRPPTTAELASLQTYLNEERARYTADLAAAQSYFEIGELGMSKMAAPELAAWTNVARVLLNLHETITRY